MFLRLFVLLAIVTTASHLCPLCGYAQDIRDVPLDKIAVPGRPDRVPGEFLIKLRAGLNINARAIGEKISAGTEGAKLVRVFTRRNLLHVSFPKVSREESPAQWAAQQKTLGKLAQNPVVEWMEPNYLYYAGDTNPGDVLIKQMWFLKNIGAFKAWDEQNTSPDVVVAVIDTGV